MNLLGDKKQNIRSFINCIFDLIRKTFSNDKGNNNKNKNSIINK